VNVEIKIQGIEKIDEMLEKIVKKAGDLEPVLHAIGGGMVGNIHYSFDNEQSPDGEAWDPLADSTLLDKSKHGKRSVMLQRDMDLYNSIGFFADGDSLAVGVNAYSKGDYPYPVVHQFGSKDGKIPARRFMPIDSDGELDDGVKEEILDLLEDFLAGL
jgi:phage gpG-like protein